MADKRGGLLTTKFPSRGAFTPVERMPDWMRTGERWREQGITSDPDQRRQVLDWDAAQAERQKRAPRWGRGLSGMDVEGLQEGLLGAAAQTPGVPQAAMAIGGALNTGPGRFFADVLEAMPPSLDMDMDKVLLGGVGAVAKVSKKAAAKKAAAAQRAAAIAQKASPEMRRALANMTALERSRVLDSEETLRGAQDLLRLIPEHSRMASAMKAGEAKKGWYAASAQALVDVFGMDAPRFAALLAATSPQTSVESNLTNALNIWVNWTKAGRPQDARAIKSIVGASVQGDRGIDSILPAWVNNTNTALTAPNPTKITLSGPKVDSFMRNLWGQSGPVTLDAWMANGLGMAQDFFGGSPTVLQQARGNPGITADYATVSAQMRRAGKLVGMTPAEAQETFWSVAMPLYEKSKRLGMSAQELLNKGLFTNRDVRGTPDFSTLFKVGRNRDILERGGYGDTLDAMQSYRWPDVNLDAAPDLTPKQQQHLMEFAQILDTTGGLRNLESSAVSTVVKGARPLKKKEQNVYNTFANNTYEFIGGADSGVGGQTGVSPAILGGSRGQRKNFSDRYNSATTDLRGRNILFESLFPGRTTSVRSMTGLFKGPKGLESQPGFSNSVRVRYDLQPDGTPAVNPDDARWLSVANRTQGLLTQQHGMPWNAIVSEHRLPASARPAPTSAFFPASKQTNAQALAQANTYDPAMAYADTGMGVAAIALGEGSGPMAGQKIKDLNQIFFDPKAKGRPYAGYNIGGYVDQQPGWLMPQMGTGVLTDEWLSEVDALPKPDRRSLEKGLGAVASRIRANVYPKLHPGDTPRQDVQNFVDIAAGAYKDPQFNPTGAQIIEAIKRARKAGVALPAVGAAAGARGLLFNEDEDRF